MSNILPNSAVKVLGYLYDAATDVEKWELFLKEFTELFSADACHIAHFDHDQQKLGFNFHYNLKDHTPDGPREITPEIWRLFEELHDKHDPRFPIYNQFPNKPHSCRSILTEEQIHNSLMYKKILSRTDIEYSLGVKLDDPDERNFTAIGVLRGKKSKAFSEEEVSLMSEYIPHIKRALKLHKRFSMLEYNYSSALEAFDKIATGIIFVNEDGRIKFRNEYASRIMRNSDGIEDKCGYIYFEDKGAAKALSLALSETSLNTSTSDQFEGASFKINKTSKTGVYAAHVCPLIGKHLSFDLRAYDEKTLVLFVSDQDKQNELPIEVLQRLFGLTKSESEILELLVSGKSTDEIALIRCVSRNTIKTHIKSLFDKTQTHKQSELIRLVLSTPTSIRYSE